MISTLKQTGLKVKVKKTKEIIQDKIESEILKANITPKKSEVLSRGNDGGYPHFLFSFNNPYVSRSWVNNFLYQNVSWVYACSNYTANAAANSGYSFVAKKKRGEKKPSNRVTTFLRSMEDLFENANIEQDFGEIYKQLHNDLSHNGKAYIIVDFLRDKPPFKTPIALYRADYRTMRPIRLYAWGEYAGIDPKYYKGYKNRIIAYAQELLDGNDYETFIEPLGKASSKIKDLNKNNLPLWRISRTSNVTYFYPEQVIEIKLDAQGTSPLDSLEYSLATEISAQQYTYAYFRNSTKPGIILSMEKGTREQALMNKQWLKDEYSNPESAYDPMFLLGGVKLVRESASTGTVQFLDIRKFVRDEVCSSMGVDPQLLSGEGNAGDKEESKRSFEENTVTPRSKLILGKFTRHFNKIFPDMKGRWELIPGVKGRSSLHLLNIAQKMGMAGATVNEMRGLIGLPEKEGEVYDMPMLAVNTMPAELMPDMILSGSKSEGGSSQAKDNNPAGQPSMKRPQDDKAGIYNEQR